MNRLDHDFNCNSLKVLALLLSSSLMIFIILFRSNSRKVNFSLLLKCFRFFFTDWFLKCFIRCFRGLFFRAGYIYLSFTALVKFVKYLFKLCHMFLLSLIIYGSHGE